MRIQYSIKEEYERVTRLLIKNKILKIDDMTKTKDKGLKSIIQEFTQGLQLANRDNVESINEDLANDFDDEKIEIREICKPKSLKAQTHLSRKLVDGGLDDHQEDFMNQNPSEIGDDDFDDFLISKNLFVIYFYSKRK